MRNELDTILEKALSMPQHQRAFLAEQLINSLDQQKIEPDIEAAWQKEIQSRVLDAKEGRVDFISWKEARQLLREGR